MWKGTLYAHLMIGPDKQAIKKGHAALFSIQFFPELQVLNLNNFIFHNTGRRLNLYNVIQTFTNQTAGDR